MDSLFLTIRAGINFSFAKSLLAKRCNVVFADLALRPEAQELIASHANGSQSPAKAVFQQTDVRDWQQLERMFNVAKSEFGGVDCVCPGAGVYEPVSNQLLDDPLAQLLLTHVQPFSSFWHPPGSPPSKDPTTSSRYASLDINLTHPIRTTQLALQHFLSSRKAENTTGPKFIIHISSIAGQVTPFHAPIYNATKHGINGFVRSLAPLDKRLGIRVTAVAPGVIRTPLWTENPEKLKMVAESDEWVTPEYVAEVMTSLVENETVEVAASGARGVGSDVGGLGTGDSREGTKTVDVQGGLILEVAKGKVRVVEQFNDAGPSGEGNTLGNIGVAFEDIFERLEGGGWDSQ